MQTLKTIYNKIRRFTIAFVLAVAAFGANAGGTPNAEQPKCYNQEQARTELSKNFIELMRLQGYGDNLVYEIFIDMKDKQVIVFYYSALQTKENPSLMCQLFTAEGVSFMQRNMETKNNL